MTPNHLFTSFVLGCSLLASATSHADPILEVKDWTLSERTTTSGGTVCVASAVDTGAFRSEIYYLEIKKTKNEINSPVEILLQVEKNKRGNTGFTADIVGSNSSIAFSALAANETTQTFWGVPKNLSGLINQLKAGNDRIQLHGRGGKKDIDFDIKYRGFSEILTEMEKRCNQGQSLVNAEFEKTFVNQAPDQIDGTKIAADKTTQIRKLYYEAFIHARSLQGTQAELAQVLSKYQAFIDELNQNRATHTQIQNVDLPQSKQRLAEAKQQQIDAKAEIARLTALIPSLEAKVQTSQKASDQAQAILAPHVPEYNRITQNLSIAQNSLSQAQSRLSQIDSRLYNLSQEISSLQREADSLEYNLQSKRNERESAIQRLRVAEQERARYNVSYERDQRLRNHAEYNQLGQEARDLDHNIPQMAQAVDAARAQRDSQQAQLDQCRAVAGQDCSQQEASLNQANVELADITRAHRELVIRRNWIDSRRSEIERNINNEVQSQYNNLVERENQARRRVNDIEDAIRRDENRISQIHSVELPHRQNEQNQLNNERYQVQSRISQAQSDISRFQQELANFKAKTDWDRKEAAVQNASNQLQADQSKLSQTRQQKANQEARLQTGIQTEADMKARIQSLEAQVVALDQRAQVLNQKLATLPAERAPLDQKIADLNSKISAVKADFLKLLM